MDPITISSILSLLGSAGAGAAGAGAAGAAGAGAAGAGAAGAGAAGAGALSGAMSLNDLLSAFSGIDINEASSLNKKKKILKDSCKILQASIEDNQDYFYEPPRRDEVGQNNASGSNAPLDKALGSDARKTLGVSEGGSIPQLDNTISRDLIGIKRTPTATQTVAPKEEGLFTKLSNWWNGLGK